VEKALSGLSADVTPLDCEVWGITPNKDPVILMGYGEDRRARYLRRQIWQRVALLIMVPVWIMLLFAAPALQARKSLQEAEQAFQILQAKSSTLEQTRNMVQMQSQSLDDVMAYIKMQPQPLAVLNLLSEKIPDTAYLQRFNINAQRVAISGQADNAAALMQVLGGVPGISNVRAPSAITRMAGSSKELFALELNVDFGVKP
jgi:general secretion pathway protein L